MVYIDGCDLNCPIGEQRIAQAVQIATECGVSKDVVARDVRDFIEALHKQDLLGNWS